MEIEFECYCEEKKIFKEVIEDIKQKYNPKKQIHSIHFKVFEPLTPKWKSEFAFSGGYNWGRNDGVILLTRCRDKKAFYELVFHELYHLLFNGNNEEIVPEERKYIEEKFEGVDRTCPNCGGDISAGEIIKKENENLAGE